MARKKVTKYRLAKEMGVEYNSVFRFFRPGYDPKLSTLAKWADILNCKICDLIEETKKK